MEFRVLGTIEVDGPSPGASPPGAKERAILARLLLDPGRTVPADALLEAVWEGVPREVAARSLAVRVANLRAFLEPGRDRGAPSSLLVRDGPGYRLQVAPEQIDSERFERCVRNGRRAARGRRAGRCSTAGWRCGAGRRSASSPTRSSRAIEVRRLEDLHSQAEAARARALVELGRPLEAIDDLRRLTAADPLREELVGTLMLALYAAGRQVEALEAYRELAARLRELGLAPGAATRALERRILEHDATLAAPSTPLVRRARAARRPRDASPSWRGCAPRWRARSPGAAPRVLAWGEPGVGKSTLVDAFLQRGVRRRRGRRRPVPRPARAGRAVHAGARGARGAGARRRRRRGRGGAGGARADVARGAALAAGRDAPTPRRSGSARRGRRARACCARCSRRSTPSAPRRRSCSCSRTCTGPTTRRSTWSPRCCAGASRRGCCCSARTAPRARRRSSSWRTSSACAGSARSSRSAAWRRRPWRPTS